VIGTISTMEANRAQSGAARSVSLSRCFLVSLSLLTTGCNLPGRPTRAAGPVPEELVFRVLYAKRCAGCHGADGKLGPAPPLNDPIFLAIVPDAELVQVIADGRTVTPGQKSLMPAFAQDNGGPLTRAQVNLLALGIKKYWGLPASPSGSLPGYIGPTTAGRANKDEGARVFARACAGCHGPDGQGEKDSRPLPGGAINNQAFLALISDQALRRLIITGRPDLGMPAYDGRAGRSPDFRALTSAEIDDLVALLKCWRQGGS
jgi:cytochrome c oxidase cbb3-type subunit 3